MLYPWPAAPQKYWNILFILILRSFLPPFLSYILELLFFPTSEQLFHKWLTHGNLSLFAKHPRQNLRLSYRTSRP